MRDLGRNYRKLWVAASISYLGDGMFVAAFPLLAASLTRDPALVAGVVLAERVPWLLFALVSGALVDRLDRRAVMVRTDAFRTAVTALLGMCVLAGWESLPLIYGFAFTLGTAQTLFDSASQTILPSVVARADLQPANARLMGSHELMTHFAGPPLGGVLFAAVASLPFLVDASSFAVGAFLLVTMRGTFRAPPTEPTALATAIREGLGWLWGHRLLRTLALMLAAWIMVETAIESIFVLYALELLGLSRAGYGIILTTAAVGGLLGSVVVSRVIALMGPRRALLAAVTASVASYVAIGTVTNRYLVGAMFAVVGFLGMQWNVITVSLRQAIIPDHLLGRVNSVYRFVSWGTMPLGALMGGLIGRAWGLRAPFFVGAAVLAMVGIISAPSLVAHLPIEVAES